MTNTLPSIPPVIILGMHRSGTSLVARVLSDLGLFGGAWKQGDGESLFFIALNVWLLKQTGCDWTCPQHFDRLLRDEETMVFLESRILRTLKSPQAVAYLGISRYLQPGNLLAMSSPWGWKDPRNTFTLPLWLRLYPDAKIIHVMRHGVDVAQSLFARQASEFEKLKTRSSRTFPPFDPHYLLRSYNVCFFGNDLAENLQLWEDYCRRSTQHVNALGNRAMTVRFEDLLMNPRDVIGRLADFCDLSADRAEIAATAESIEPGRRFAYKQTPSLKAFAREHAELLARFGYEG